MGNDRVDGSSSKLFRVLQVHAGLSRRKAQELVTSGEVSMDGEVVGDPFLTIDPGRVQTLRLRGHPISLVPPEHRAYRYHKPSGMLCSHDDRFCGNTVGRVMRAEGFVGYTWAGRLDQDAEGLLLITNDGQLVQHLSHPRYEVRKTYHVWTEEALPSREVRRLLDAMRRGIVDREETLRIVDGTYNPSRRQLTLTLTEGRKREIKRLIGHFGLHVSRLRRVAIGPIALGDLAEGALARIIGDDASALARLLEH